MVTRTFRRHRGARYMRNRFPWLLSLLFAVLLLHSGVDAQKGSSGDGSVYAPVPDFSGLQWIDGNRFLAVHDAKNPKELEGFARVSMVWLPSGLDGIRRKTLEIAWPEPQGPSSDLESIARIPGTDRFLLVESGGSSSKKTQFKRGFLVELKGDRLEMLGFLELPDVENIEGSAIVKTVNGLIFIWAERSPGKKSTTVSWAKIDPEKLSLGEVFETVYRPAGFTGKNWRPVSALDIDSSGVVYVASGYDTDDDAGPFASVIWRIGRIDGDAPLSKMLSFDRKPELIARVDGVKIEALTVVEREGKYELFYGYDDEYFGGGLRRIALRNPNGR